MIGVEPVEPVQMTIDQSNNYRKDLSCQYFEDEPRAQEDQQSCISVFVAYLTIPTRSDMATVFHAWAYGREQPQEKETSWNKSRFQFSWRQF